MNTVLQTLGDVVVKEIHQKVQCSLFKALRKHMSTLASTSLSERKAIMLVMKSRFDPVMTSHLQKHLSWKSHSQSCPFKIRALIFLEDMHSLTHIHLLHGFSKFGSFRHPTHVPLWDPDEQ